MKYAMMMVLTVISLTNVRGQTPVSDDSSYDESLRTAKPFTLSYHSHWFLLGGVRAGYRLWDDYTEVTGQLSQSIVSGCGIQAPECETGVGLSFGIRRYVTETPFTGYIELNAHYFFDGIRFMDESGLATEINGGINHLSESGFIIGVGYGFFFFNDDPNGFSIGNQGWFLTEIGFAF